MTMARRLIPLLMAGSVVISFQGAASGQAEGDQPIRIMALGDSITGSPGCWRAYLWQDLIEGGFTDIDMVGSLEPEGCGFEYDGEHEGHGGIKTRTIASSGVTRSWLKLHPADILLVHLGTNDIWGGGSSTKTILDDFSVIVEDAREVNPEIAILIAQIIPMASDSCIDCPDRIIELNSAIPNWAEEVSRPESPVWSVDQWTGFDPGSDTYDGVHPNDTGNLKIAARWFEALVPVLESISETPSSSGERAVSEDPDILTVETVNQPLPAVAIGLVVLVLVIGVMVYLVFDQEH